MASQTRHLAICPDGMKHPDRNNLASMRSSPMRLVIEVKEGEEEDPTPKSTTKVFRNCRDRPNHWFFYKPTWDYWTKEDAKVMAHLEARKYISPGSRTPITYLTLKFQLQD